MVLQAFQDAMKAQQAAADAALPQMQQQRRRNSGGSNSSNTCGTQQQQELMRALYRMTKKIDDQHLHAMQKIAEVAEKVDALNTNLSRLAELSAVRTQNSGAGPEAALEWPKTLNGRQPADVCATVSEVAAATECHLDSLLRQYRLSSMGQLGVKRRRLLRHIGVRYVTKVDEGERVAPSG